MVRATLGRRSGPMTTSATIPMRRSSEKLMSNIGSGFRFFLHFAFYGLPVCTGSRIDFRLLGIACSHAFLEALHCAAQIAADIPQLLRAENQQNDQKDDEPV